MLSYRHSFHAGNFADVLKHIMLVDVLQHMALKDKPFDYIDTHAGAGLYAFNAEDAQKKKEHESGILKLVDDQDPLLKPYLDAIAHSNHGTKTNRYPGSPLIASQFLRPQDRAWLFELHPQDHRLLENNLRHQKKTRISRSDGLKGLIGLMPPQSKRAVVLIDPSYELKNEFDQVFDSVLAAHRRFATGVYLIWYPVVDRRKVDIFIKKFKNSGMKNINQYELGVMPESQGHGMTASGMLVINPPWQLHEKMKSLLPNLASRLSLSGAPVFSCEVLVPE